MLKGRVPDAVRLRTEGRPFSPDFVSRLKREAPGVRARLPLFREAGIGRVLDLASLETMLMSLQTTERASDYTLFYSVQGTTVLAEFLLWATTMGVRLT